MGGVGIGYAHGGTVHEPFMRSLMNSWIWDSTRAKIISGYFSSGGLYVAVNRNRVCEEFLKKDGEYLWFLDTDMVFDEDALYKLIQVAQTNNIDILSALYFGRMVSGVKTTQPVWLMEANTGVYENVGKFGHGLQEVDAIGMGCCLIHRPVLEKMAEVYNEDEWQWFGHDRVQRTDGTWTHLGEDLTFCRRAKALGFKIYGTGAVIVGHLKQRMEDLDTFKESPACSKFEITDSAA